MAWILLALIFAALWAYAFYREDHHRPEPFWMVFLATASGCAAFFLADWLEAQLVPNPELLFGAWEDRARIALLVSGPVEEGAKLLGVLLLVWPWTHFDESLDGITYGAAAGAGFALLENLAFMQEQPDIILGRGPVATGAHVLFSVIWGGALGFSGHLPNGLRKVGVVVVGLLLASLAHGLFNLVTFSVGMELTLAEGRAWQIALMLLCALFIRWRIRIARSLPPFRTRA